MTEKVIKINTLNDKPEHFEQLFNIWSQVNNDAENVRFDFSQCSFLRPNAVAFLGGLARLIESRRGSVVFDWDTINNSWVRATIRQNGFAGMFGDSSPSWEGHSIPYREDRSLDLNGISDYLTFNWIGKGRIHVSDRLRDDIVGWMWEIYNNAFEHSASEIGVFSCGQHLWRKKKLILSVVDFGQGIPTNVKNFLRQYAAEDNVARLKSKYCLEWAFESGHSTSIGHVARGIGLDLLKEFIHLNQGKLEVYSNDGYAIIDENGDRYEDREISFAGTIVHITLRCNEKLYQLKDEADSP